MQDFLNEMNKVIDVNKHVTYDGREMLSVLQEIEYILISLHKMGSYYFDKDRRLYEEETTKFIDDSCVCDRLAKIRTFLSKQYDLSVGEDEMDDVERACERVRYWTAHGETSMERWLK